jgi:hypothetical protein
LYSLSQIHARSLHHIHTPLELFESALGRRRAHGPHFFDVLHPPSVFNRLCDFVEHLTRACRYPKRFGIRRGLVHIEIIRSAFRFANSLKPSR